MAKATVLYIDPRTHEALLRIGSTERWYGSDRKPLENETPGRWVMHRRRLRESQQRLRAIRDRLLSPADDTPARTGS